MLGKIEAKFNQSLINPDEMCGTLTSQSISEPAMKMMLPTNNTPSNEMTGKHPSPGHSQPTTDDAN